MLIPIRTNIFEQLAQKMRFREFFPPFSLGYKLFHTCKSLFGIERNASDFFRFLPDYPFKDLVFKNVNVGVMAVLFLKQVYGLYKHISQTKIVAVLYFLPYPMPRIAIFISHRKRQPLG